MKRDRKTVCLIYVILFSISGCNNAFFEVDTKVKLEEGATPPRFYLTGNGASPIFLVFGPYEGDYGKDGDPPPLWELDPKPEARGMEVSKYSPFTYGRIPSGYMRIIDLRERTIPISRYSDPQIPSDGLNTTAVAIVTDVHRNGAPVVGFGFSSIGRFGQSGLIRERFAPRLLAAREDELAMSSGDNLDPFRAWDCMMKGEKPGGHGERCVAVGTLDMALWDAAAKIAEKPLYRFLGDLIGKPAAHKAVPVYAGGGYYFPSDDIPRLTDEVRQFLGHGYTHVKIKIAGRSIGDDLKRIEAVLSLLPGSDHLAVDAMNRYNSESAIRAAQALSPYRLRWFEDMCDPLDFETHAQIARAYDPPLAVGEALFSLADARNLLRYGALRPERDVLLFDPAHCYGLPEYLRILEMLESNGWSRKSCQPHGGHLFSLHVAAALGLGGSESNPHNFQPFGGFADEAKVEDGSVRPPEATGIGFERRSSLYNVFRSLLGNDKTRG